MVHVLQLRGGLVELEHPVAVAVWEGGAEGRLSRGSRSDYATCWRSAAKPVQLLAALEAMDGAAASENTPFTSRSLSDEELAIGASSHSGEPQQVALVAQLLARFGLSVDHLQCGTEAPMHPGTRDALIRADSSASPLHNDCSGKHAFMLGASRSRGWPLSTYLSPHHPLQQRVTARASALSGARPAVTIDGCGLPALWMPVAAMARAWSSLALAMADPDRDPLLARVGWAMAHHPELTSGRGRIDLALARRAREPWVGKIGALGVFCIALPDRGLGLAFKVLSGDEDALAVAVSKVVQRVCPEVLSAGEAPWPYATVRNVVGRSVGQRVVTGLDGV